MILLAYVIAIPANEIVVPTMLMLYLGTGMMTELSSIDGRLPAQLLVDQHGWTLLTAVNLMLFSLLHNPCATTIYTIWKETLSAKWAAARRAPAARPRLYRHVRRGGRVAAGPVGTSNFEVSIRGTPRTTSASPRRARPRRPARRLGSFRR